jgi:hypothetical protein
MRQAAAGSMSRDEPRRADQARRCIFKANTGLLPPHSNSRRPHTIITHTQTQTHTHTHARIRIHNCHAVQQWPQARQSSSSDRRFALGPVARSRQALWWVFWLPQRSHATRPVAACTASGSQPGPSQDGSWRPRRDAGSRCGAGWVNQRGLHRRQCRPASSTLT